MDGKLSFNIYVIHGGTNFGYTAGANASDDGGNYQPHVTSYDYGAPITEQGRPTVLYTSYRNLIASYVGTLPDIPATPQTVTGVTVTPTPYASLWDNLPSATQAVDPRPMETYGQNSGFMLYRRSLSGFTGGALAVNSVHDYATVFLDGKYQGGISRTAVPSSYAGPLKVTTGNSLTLPSGTRLDILVEGLGRINFGHGLVDRKGITQQVTAAGQVLANWETYPLPVDESYVANLRPVVSDPNRPGLFFRTTFTLSAVGDTFLDMTGWTHGLVWVNGNNLGRYWRIGPQNRLFCPAQWLTTGTNEIVVLDLHQLTPAPVQFKASAADGFTITNRRSGKVLDVPGSSRTQGTQLIQYAPNGGANQQWRISDAGTITNVSSGMLVDVEGAATNDGARVIQWPSNGGDNQQWRLTPVDGGHVKIVSVHSGKLIGVAGDSTGDSAEIVQQTDTGTTSQHWTVTSL
ncbi:hypothetical protein GCM10029964_037320 [Kibdelosporangium lantanae]